MFYCNILKEDINNIELWERKIRNLIKTTSIIKVYKKILNRYEFDNFDDYINYIKINFNNKNKLDELDSLYKKNLLIQQKNEELIEKKRIGLLLLNSIKYHNPNVKIRMLIEKDAKKIYPIYYDFKTNYMKEDITQEDSNDYVDDFILKNIIYGIFEKNILSGIMICTQKKFNIDNNDSKINTFYIQEIIVDKKFTGKNYGSLLINYAILICPNNLEFISFMTTHENKGMHRIASKLNFIKQEKSSGDPLNPALFIRANNSIDRIIYNNLNYLKSTISSIYI